MGEGFISITAESFRIWGEPAVDRAAKGVIALATGNTGIVIFGPFEQVSTGIYLVKVDVTSGAASFRGSWDVFSEGQVHGSRNFSESLELVVHIPETSVLEVRFKADMDAFELAGVQISPILQAGDEHDAGKIGEFDELWRRGAVENHAAEIIARKLFRAGFEQAGKYCPDIFDGNGVYRPEVEDLFRHINRPHAVQDKSFLAGGATTQQVADFVREQVVSVFDLFDPSGGDRQAITERGYRLEAFEAMRAFSKSEPPLSWQIPPNGGEAHYRSRDSGFFDALTTLDFVFQSSLARGEGVSAVCPITGRTVTSHHGFSSWAAGFAVTIYRFESVETFYLFAGGFPNAKLFVYLPSTNTVVWILPDSMRFISAEPPVLVREFNEMLLNCSGEIFDYLANETRLALMLAGGNLGHFLWNDFGGIHRLVEAGHASNVGQIVQLNAQFLEVQDVFPELEDCPRFRFDNALAAFRHNLTNRLLPFRAAECVLDDGFSQRMKAAASRQPATANFPPLTVARPLIWINLRSHNKVWVDQAAGYANILNALQDEYGEVTVLLDGVADCAAVAEEIRRRVYPGVTIFEGLDLTIFESLNWAFAIDAYLCTIGSGLTLVTWIAGKVGVAHAERMHLQQMTWWKEVRPDVLPPLHPTYEQIDDIGGEFYCNYNVDWRLLLSLLREVLARSEKQALESATPPRQTLRDRLGSLLRP
jgi:hypothetical protein